MRALHNIAAQYGIVDPPPARIPLSEWRKQFQHMPPDLKARFVYLKGRLGETAYLDEPSCFAEESGDYRLHQLLFDNSLASLRLWSFLLSEEDRLWRSRKSGMKVIGALKDLGTVPVIAYSSDDAVCFYPDGAWWIPCIMEMSAGLLEIADSEGFGEECCPARAAVAAFIKGTHFPIPDLVLGAVGACCDDFSAIMQRIADYDIKLHWWELPHRSDDYADADAPFDTVNGLRVPTSLVDFVERELARVTEAIGDTLGRKLTEDDLARGVAISNRLRDVLRRIRDLCYGTTPAPFPALETQICEMIGLHYCSGRDEAIEVLEHVYETAKLRAEQGIGPLQNDACRVVWVNPVADLRVMNIFENYGGALAGAEYLFRHALIPLRTDIRPLRALALAALADPMIGPSEYRARLVVEDAKKYNAEGVIISKIPGASHCSTEGRAIKAIVAKELGLPVLDITVSPLTDTYIGQMSTRFEAYFELIRSNRRH